jgi:hypothetical protein
LTTGVICAEAMAPTNNARTDFMEFSKAIA